VKRYTLTPRRKTYGKILARSLNTSKSLALRVMKDPQALKWIVGGVGKILHYEIRRLCCESTNSVIKSKSKDHISIFPWTLLRNEISKYCPTFNALLLKSTATNSKRCNQTHLISVIVCMLCKFRCSDVSLLQRMVSALLYSGHVGTAVYDRLQKIKFCMSAKSTVAMIDSLGQGNDDEVTKWKDTLKPVINERRQVQTVCDLDDELGAYEDVNLESETINEMIDYELEHLCESYSNIHNINYHSEEEEVPLSENADPNNYTLNFSDAISVVHICS
jgi:hypothetical protein